MTWGIVALLAVVICGILYWAYHRPKTDHSSILLFQQQITSLQNELQKVSENISKNSNQQFSQFNDRVDSRLKETATLVQSTHQTVGERIDRNTQVFVQLQERLAKLDETNKSIHDVGKDIARLQEILSVPKLRGNLGELFLEELLSQILPSAHYQMQYPFKNGEKVDAILRLPQGHLISIDAKFPLENFQRMLEANLPKNEQDQYRKAFISDFKRRVDEIAVRYIRPDENTLDFAFMYVPAENVYYEAMFRTDDVADQKSIHQYAMNKRVVPVSPNTLYAYLQAIVLGLRGLKIESQAKEIFSYLTNLQIEFTKLSDELSLISKHFANAKTTLDKSEKRVQNIQDKINHLELKDEENPPKMTLVGNSEG